MEKENYIVMRKNDSQLDTINFECDGERVKLDFVENDPNYTKRKVAYAELTENQVEYLRDHGFGVVAESALGG